MLELFIAINWRNFDSLTFQLCKMWISSSIKKYISVDEKKYIPVDEKNILYFPCKVFPVYNSCCARKK